MLFLIRRVDTLLTERIDTGSDVGDHFTAGPIFYPEFIFSPLRASPDALSDTCPVLPVGDQRCLKFGKRFYTCDVLGHKNQLIVAVWIVDVD